MKEKGAIRLIPVLLVVLAVGVFLALNSVYSINEQEQAVVVTLGSPSTVSTPGLHFKIPFLQQVRKSMGSRSVTTSKPKRQSRRNR